MKLVLLPPQVLWRITNPHINSGTLQTQMVQVKYYAYVHIMLNVYLYSTVEAVPCQVSHFSVSLAVMCAVLFPSTLPWSTETPPSRILHRFQSYTPEPAAPPSGLSSGIFLETVKNYSTFNNCLGVSSPAQDGVSVRIQEGGQEAVTVSWFIVTSLLSVASSL